MTASIITTITIDLSEYVTPQTRSLVSIDLARGLSEEYDVFAHLCRKDKFVVFVPHHVFNIGSAFLEGLFGEILRLISLDAFYKLVSFDGDDPVTLKGIDDNLKSTWKRLNRIGIEETIGADSASM